MQERVAAALEENGPSGLLALVMAERSKMSTSLLGSADMLSSAVMHARKKLAANIAAVEVAVKAEKEALEKVIHDMPKVLCISTPTHTWWCRLLSYMRGKVSRQRWCG